MKVKGVMARRLVFVNQNETLKTAALIMSQSKLGVLLVAEKKVVTGFMSKRDLASWAQMKGSEKKKSAVFHLMSRDIVWLNEEDEIEDATASMFASKVTTAVVKNSDGKVVGTITENEKV